MNAKRIIFLILVFGIFPLSWALYQEKSFSIFFLIAIFSLCAWRILETFLLSSPPQSTSRDLNFSLLVLAYFIVLYGSIAEFFLLDRGGLYFLTPAGAALLVISAVLRFWAIRTLGPQWTTDISSETTIRLSPMGLKREGPYRYVRHPVYLGAIIEILAIAIMGQALYVFLFASVVNVPLYVMRARIEERALSEAFKEEFRSYSSQVGAFMPFTRKQDKLTRYVGGGI